MTPVSHTIYLYSTVLVKVNTASLGHILYRNTEFSFNLRLILGLQQDPKFLFGLKNSIRTFTQKCRIVGSNILSVNIFKNTALSIAILVVFSVPFRAEASVFSFISNLFSTPAEAQEIGPNSQTMPLLQATISPNLDASTTKDDISIVEGTSLSSNAQPFGESKNPNSDQISIYVVHPGDTIDMIAKMYGVSVNTIRWGNDISGNSISVGQKLVILPISGVSHTVKSGDTIQSIAKKYGGDVDEIKQYNNLAKDYKLAVGDVIVVPDGEVSPTPVKKPSSGSTKPAPGYPVYEGYYMRPIIGGIRTQGVHGHNGIDLASSYGANILASADGEVLISRNSGWNGGYGSYIVLKHNNGTQTLYAHMSGTAVSAGQTVKQGQIIGYMGKSGQVTGHTGVHLHFEIRGARNPF